MKNLLLQTFIAILIGTSCIAQQKISIIKPLNGNVLSYQASIAGRNVDVKSLDTKVDITISPDASLTENTYQLNIENSSGQDITNAQLNTTSGIITGIATGRSLYLILKSSGFQDLKIEDIGKTPLGANALGTNTGTGGGGSPQPGINAKDFLLTNFSPAQYSYDDLKSLVMSGIRYNSKRDKAFIILDENGRLIGNVPVNLDQDDKIFFYLVVDKRDVDKYDLEVVGGEYSPVDLQIRSYEPINMAKFSAQGSKIPADWTVIQFERGPYTSDNVTFNIKKTDKNENSQTETKVLSTYTLKFNKLYHVEIGVSFVSTNLAKPDYDLFPLTDSTNTINKINNNRRTMFTFNVIWYWFNTFKYFRKGDDLTRGRDILKEPNWTRRLNPTFGVTLDNTFKENFFLGGTYEFARGGSFCFGGHYGKIKKLETKDLNGKDFNLGESEYKGTLEEIKLSDGWKWDWFFGITLDTRIFNKILSRS